MIGRIKWARAWPVFVFVLWVFRHSIARSNVLHILSPYLRLVSEFSAIRCFFCRVQTRPISHYVGPSVRPALAFFAVIRERLMVLHGIELHMWYWMVLNGIAWTERPESRMFVCHRIERFIKGRAHLHVFKYDFNQLFSAVTNSKRTLGPRE